MNSMSNTPETATWRIQESIRWPAILGIGFAVPALLTFAVSTSQHVSYVFTVVLSALGIPFFWWDWSKHHVPLAFLRSVEVLISPPELRDGDVASCEVRLPSSRRIRVRYWSFSVAMVEPDDDLPELASSVFWEVKFTGDGNVGDSTARPVLRCEVLIPKEPNVSASEGNSLRIDASVQLYLGRWGIWIRPITLPIQSRIAT
jgi:hypothetical protein